MIPPTAPRDEGILYRGGSGGLTRPTAKNIFINKSRHVNH